MTAEELSDAPRAGLDRRARQRVLMWLMLSALAAALAYFGFRGYLDPELLFHFASGMYC